MKPCDSDQNTQSLQPKKDIVLSTSTRGQTISILGNGTASLPKGQAATHFRFLLNDTSGANVKFSALDSADGIATCPPTGSGNCSRQIVGVSMNNNADPRTAQFTDNNNNKGQLNVSYQWNFTCDPPYLVEPFDPVISNGGRI